LLLREGGGVVREVKGLEDRFRILYLYKWYKGENRPISIVRGVKLVLI
jgi:hypothetical protein